MGRGRSQFVGTAGQYYVAYCLSIREKHAVTTMGNAPDVDIIVAAPNGSKTLSIQVKTSRYAHRPNRYGYELREWDVGPSAPDLAHENLWYAFVDLQEEETQETHRWKPMVFLVPSRWVANFVQKDWSRKMFLLRREAWPLCEEKWERIDAYFRDDEERLNWCRNVPEEVKDWS